MIGSNTGKVIGIQTTIKTCRVCEHAKHNKSTPREHSCRKNWTGSAKAMEADMVVSMMQQTESQEAFVKTIVGDEDSSTIAKVHREVRPDIEKRSDSNHLKKILGNELYSIKSSHQMSVQTIKYVQKLFNYVCKQNEGNPEGIEKGLDAMSKHPFDDHSSCNKQWCKHMEDPSAKFGSLPYNKPLKDASLQRKLEALCQGAQ